MKTMSSALRTLLATGEFVKADCWTITLNGGLVVRWSGADIPIKANGQTFALGPLITRGSISEKRGVEVATLDCTITAIAGRDSINGQPIIPFIKSHGLDGAVLKLERAYAADWPDMARNGALGTLIRFAGKITSVPEASGASAKFVASSWLILLNAMMPRNLYQSACLHTLYDSGCTLDPASFSTSGVVSDGGQTNWFGHALSFPTNDLALGRVIFTSGANAGISRTIRSNAGADIYLVQPTPELIVTGDAFTVFPGCDLTTSRCSTRFANLDNFKGTPFVPLPQTPLGSQSTTTTTRRGK